MFVVNTNPGALYLNGLLITLFKAKNFAVTVDDGGHYVDDSNKQLLFRLDC